MRATIVLTDENGQIYEGVAFLNPRQSAPKLRKSNHQEPRPIGNLDFTDELPHFMSTHGRDMSGPKKFALLLAYLCKGVADKEKSIIGKDIERQWNKTTRIMGMTYNPAYATRAIDSGWVSSPKRGQFQLKQNWSIIFSK